MIKLQAKNPDFLLWILLPQATDVLLKVRENELRECGLTRAQAGVLFILKALEHPPTPADIARYLFREPNTISALINRMDQQELILKVRDQERKNQFRILITDKGDQLYEQAKEMTSMHKVFSCISTARKQRLISYLETLRDSALDELVVKPKILFP